jgi:hypothetical protein
MPDRTIYANLKIVVALFSGIPIAAIASGELAAIFSGVTPI